MTKTMCALGLMTTFVLAGAAGAQAQEPVLKTGFISVDVGAQSTQHDLLATQTPTIYSEKATITESQPIHNGPIAAFGVGFPIAGNLAVGARVSYFGFGSASDAAIDASIPDPIFYDSPKRISTTLPDLKHSELGIHLQAIWFARVSDKFDIALSAGPSLIRVSQELAAAAVAPGTQNLTLSKSTEDGMAVGFNVGGDGTFMFSEGLGVAVFVRFAQGTVDLDSAPGLKVGGLQSGIGLRLRF